MILVDSSVWIASWQGRNPTLTARLTQLVETEAARINWLIRTELLQGAKNRRHQREIKTLLEPIGVDPFPPDFWEEAPLLYLKAREKGKTLTTIDSLIATHALLSRIPLWSLDTVFRQLEGVTLFDESV